MYNIMVAWVVDREFWLYRLGSPSRGEPWASFGATLDYLWLPLVCLGLPVTVLWRPFGRLGPLVVTFEGHFGGSWVTLGVLTLIEFAHYAY